MSNCCMGLLTDFIRMRLVKGKTSQKVVSNIGWLFADKALRMGVGVLVGAWVARYLGPQGFGTFNYAYAFVGLFSVLATLGLDGIVVRDIVRDTVAKDKILGSAFLLRVTGGIVTLVISTIVIFLLKPDDNLMHWLVAITAAGLIFQAFDAIDYWFQSQVKSKYTVIAKNTAFIIVALVKVGLILSKAPLVAFAWAALIEVMLGSLGLVLFYKISGQSMMAWRSSFSGVKVLLNDSWPLILSGFAIMVYMKIDQIMIGEILGTQMVGLYTAATKISEIWYFIPIAIVSSFAPSLIEAKKVDEGLYYRRFFKLFQLMAAISLCIAIPMTFLSDHIINILYGSRYAAAGSILAVHIWTGIFVFLGVAQAPWTVNEGLMKLSLLRTVLGAITNIGLNLFLIPAYGGVGAALATLVTQALSSWIFNFFDKRTRHIFYLQMRSLDITKYFAKDSSAA